MRNISFFLTQDQIRDRTKTITRRLGWKNLKAGTLLQACVKCQGLKPGEKIQKICVIKVESVITVQLHLMPKSDCAKEGFPDITPDEFVEMFCKEMKCTPKTRVTRITFSYVDED